MLTAVHEEDVVRMAMKEGAAGYVTKPVDLAYLTDDDHPCELHSGGGIGGISHQVASHIWTHINGVCSRILQGEQ